MVLADIDSDTDLDIITANNAGNNISILPLAALNLGSRVDVAVATSPHQIVAGFDGDLDIDLATVNDANGNVTILLNNGAGVHPRVMRASPPTYTSPSAMWITSSSDTSRRSVFSSQTMALLINRSRRLRRARPLRRRRNEGVALTDVDGDTDLDLSLSLRPGRRPAGNQERRHRPVREPARHGEKFYHVRAEHRPITVGDFDGDSDPDIAMGHYFDSDVSIVKNDVSGGRHADGRSGGLHRAVHRMRRR